ncbi:sigma factor-like helix-turn-helix DNA-binding protein [Thalassoroseus pseudoceratinae]|uniref:sigma factor-like helix-turn-helix DNA-binding protein n=1 Tax=Thalassoroseus pseudoceratinae TaxID=2713176 RepID=UPI001422BC2D|nr:sigma factor-like helix-turn-helix DNA-binding protein [Thalassoroseus pseudoceratinae]
MKPAHSGFSRIERLILILRHYEELTFEEIAKLLSHPRTEIESVHTNILRQQFRLCS